MRRIASFLGALGAILLCVGLVGEFIDGVFCTRIPWLLVGPIDALRIIALPCILVGTFGGIFIVGKSLIRREPLPDYRWRTLLLGWIAIVFVVAGDMDPRCRGLRVRAQVQEEALMDFCRAYRAGGESAAAGHRVAGWCKGFPVHFRATKEFVEVRWGSALPKSWGFRIDDQTKPVPHVEPYEDAEGASATERITVFIGNW